MKSHRIIVFGDSITWGSTRGGWVHKLNIDLGSRENSEYSLYNCGVAGDNTRGLLKRFNVENEARF